jgi:phosphohistidine phosphatase SixA
MVHIKLVVLRHAKSCSNHMRTLVNPNDVAHPLVQQSEKIRDPGLTEGGKKMAEQYRPRLHTILEERGIHQKTARIGSSALRRAQETAHILFPACAKIEIMPFVTEHGDIPENTPHSIPCEKPDWTQFLRHLSDTTDGRKELHIVLVGHGTFMGKYIWTPLRGDRTHRFRNLEGMYIEGELQDGILYPSIMEELSHTFSEPRDDRCSIQEEHKYVQEKIRAHNRTMKGTMRKKTQKRKQHTKRGVAKTRKQRGGMPLAFYNNGAQFRGLSEDMTGIRTEDSNSTWARLPQRGGFTPSVMGGFASHGMRLLPVAAYMGHKMMKRRTTRKQRKHT